MDNSNLIIIIFLIFQQIGARPLANSRIIEFCQQLDKSTLSMIMGPAYNPRYMSIQKPLISSKHSSGTKREYYEESFFVDDTYQHEISSRPAWEVDHVQVIASSSSSSSNSQRLRRSTENESEQQTPSQLQQQHQEVIRDTRKAFIDKISPNRDNVFKGRPWECESRSKWIDLGYNYFPRYIRTIECTRKECWYGHYTCKPRSFTVKVLRRHTSECTKINEKFKFFAGFDKYSGDLTELWTWEEKAVNFCCDCVSG